MEMEKSISEEAGLSRRDFGRRMATLAAASVALPAVMATPEVLKAGMLPEPAAEMRNAAAGQAAHGLGPVDQAEVEAKYNAMIVRYGSRLTEAQKKHAHEDLEYMQRSLGPLRAFPLDNGDEPATIFGPLPSGAGWESEE